MISNGLTQLIIYKEIDKNKYLYFKSYEICVGTSCEELGLSTQNIFIDISQFSKSSIKEINIQNKNFLLISYLFPKIVNNDLIKFATDYSLNNLGMKQYFDRPLIVFVNSNFNFDTINEYIKKYSEYGTKEND